MTGAHVERLATLHDLKVALGVFGGRVQEVLQAVEIEIKQAVEWLQGRIRYWQHEVEIRKIEVRKAEAALASCRRGAALNSGNKRSRENPCLGQEMALAQARARLAEAELQLANARTCLGEVQKAAAKYRVHARKVTALVTSRKEKAQAVLVAARTQLERYLGTNAVSGTGSAVVAGLVGRMEQGTVDLSGPTEWGKFAHSAYEEKVEAAFPGQAQSEVRVRVRLPDGTEKEGRIDSLVGTTVVDYKTHDLSKLNEDGRLERTLDAICTQVQGYCASPDLAPGASAIIVFESPPRDPACRSFIEERLRSRGIGVVWGS